MKLKKASRIPLTVELDLDDGQSPPGSFSDFRLKRILVPVDFSPLSRKALHYAIAFARQFNAEILLLHALEPMPSGPDMFQVASALENVQAREQAGKQLARWRRAVVSRALVKARILDGAPHHEIVRAAEENNTDLIIIGMHGRKGLWNYLLGGTTKRVVRLAPCPVLVVREHEHDFLTKSESEETVKKLKPLKHRTSNLNKN